MDLFHYEIESWGGFDTTGAILKSVRSANGWYAMATSSGEDYILQDNVQCIKIEVGIKPLAPPAPPGGGPFSLHKLI
jgi:hypothetical protein